ncbi:MAG: hypothetical protein QG556_1121, partial [Pseudomonadota bacterium]|nr:hypothetical protein [Pseudomonadota bacterium]
PNMLHAKDFYIFCQAASNGHLKILDRLIELLPRNEIQNMLHTKDFYIFCQAASNGHLKILDRLIELLPENEIPNMLRANDFAIFCQVASNNQIKILDRLLGLLPENEIPNMLRAYNFSVFHSVAEHGHLSILDRFLGLLPENEIPNMLSSHFFCVFRRANENGHLSILERLIRLLPENEIPHMFRAQTLFRSAAETEEDLFYILEGLMTFPSIFNFAEREIGLEIHVKDFINLTLIFLRIEIEAHQINNPTIVFDVLDSDKAQLYSYILRNLIRQNKSQNFEAVALLLQIPSVHLLASENNFYFSEQGDFYKQLPKNELISFFRSLPSSINSLIIDGNKYAPPASYLLNFPESKLETLYQDYVSPLDNENDELLTFKAIEPLVTIDKKIFIELIELFEQHPTPQSDIACFLLLEGRIINDVLSEKPQLQDTNKADVLQIFDSFNKFINIRLEIFQTILTRNDKEFFPSALAQYVENHMTPIMDSATRCRLYALDFLRRAACNAAQEIAKTIEAIASHIKATEPVDSPIFQKLSLLSFSQEQGFLESTQPNPSFIIDSNMLPVIDINSLRKLCDCVSGYKHGLFSQAKVSVMNKENNANNDHRSSSATR